MRRAAAGSRGLALVSVLWLLLLLAVIAGATLRGARTETAVVRNELEAAEARLLAEAGVQRAFLGLLEDDPETRWRADGTRRAWRFAGQEVLISVHDEAGKIDLNEAPTALLIGLFAAAGAERRAAAALADAVADFRDGNDLSRLNGAEDADYRRAGYPWGAKDGPFERVAELAQVLGMTPELLARVEHAVTVHSGRAAIDAATAPRLALLAVPGLEPAAVDRFLARRNEREPGGQLPGAGDFLSGDGAGAVFELRAEARGKGGARFLRSAIVRTTSLPGAPFRVESWEQGTAGEAPEDGPGVPRP